MGDAAYVSSLATVNGVLYAGTGGGSSQAHPNSFGAGVWSWDGSSWAQVGSLPDNAEGILCLAAANGVLYAGTAGNGVWSWNGTLWSKVGNNVGYMDVNYVLSLATVNSMVYEGTDYLGVWSWNGTSWSQVGGVPGDHDSILSLAAFNGTLYAGTNGGLWSWNGSSWLHVGGLLNNEINVISLATINGALYASADDGVFVLTVFSDIPSSYWAYAAIESLSGLGDVSGYPDGTFKPGSQITRAEFVSILDKAVKLQTYGLSAPGFSDISSSDWFYRSVESAVYAGIVKGYGNDQFAPNKPITREELAVILVNALGKQAEAMANMNAKTDFTDDVSISTWARGFLVVAVQDGLLKGYQDNSFQPQSNATRAEACAMVVNSLNDQK